MNSKKQFFKLLKYSNQLKKIDRSLYKENPKSFDILLKFLVKIENNFHYLEKEKYIKLVKDFLGDKITADDFSYSFMAIYEGINKKIIQIEIEESSELANFLKSDLPTLGRLLALIYSCCDSYSSDPEVDIAMSNEKELKYYAQMLLFELQQK